ncbi:MAG TPA: T9SS type A sorting domain-containing protein [Bacteroidia bacterium]|nr:T9SS type A sorting domain-containing protein [Bacteroidia bacterium]
MKKSITLILFTVIAFSANATVHIVTCQNSPSHFLPVTVNALVGDTIHWTWVVGGHIVGPINASDIPVGASLFNAPINASNLSFDYVVTVAGNYHYVCHPATPHGEDGYIVVTGTTAVEQNHVQNNILFVYPNPSNGKFQVVIDNALINKTCKIGIYNLQGRLIYQTAISCSKSVIDLSSKPTGIYLAEFYIGESILTKKIIIQ